MFTSVFGEELGNAAFMAAAAYLGGAAFSAYGGAGAAAGGTSAAGAGAGAGAAAGAGAGTAAGAVGSAWTSSAALTGAGLGGIAGYQQGAAKVAAERQEAANVAAESRANEALRQQEIMRKTALLAEQRTLSSRQHPSLLGDNNDKLTEEQQDLLYDYNVDTAESLKDLFKTMLSEGTGGLSDEIKITTLYNLLKFDDQEWVIVDGYGDLS